MSARDVESRSARRLFLARMGIGAGVITATLAPPVARAAHRTWQPARHTQDDWLDKIPGIHRVVFDTATPDEMQAALRYAQNFYLANRDAYGLKDSDLAIVIIARHTSTPFGYNDAIWAKYGKELSQRIEFIDPQTKQPPRINVLAAQASGSQPAGRIAELINRGAQFAVCGMASRELAGMIGTSIGVDADAVDKELGANLIGNARMVPAGIVAVNRAQEHGYTLM